MKRILCYMACLCTLWGISIATYAQEEEKKWRFSGYIKDMVIVNLADDSTLIDNLIHSRLNLEWTINSHWSVKSALRTRLFLGDMPATFPNYGEFIDNNNDYLDLSYYTPREGSWLLHTMIDRAYIEYFSEKWEITAGRQRINWGVNLVWNPNDIFNSYSFFDFDYEERPGSDAMRVHHYTGVASGVEVAIGIHDDIDQVVAAGRYRFNVSGYDIQLLAGKAREDLVVGVGWAGNLKDAGFKGEISYLHPYKDQNSVSDALVASGSIDYSFENSLYLHASYLYHSEAELTITESSLLPVGTGRLTVRNLSPFKHSAFFQATYEIHPLIRGGMAFILYPTAESFFLNPTISFSVKPNLDLDLISQLYYQKTTEKTFDAQARYVYVRGKWSF